MSQNGMYFRPLILESPISKLVLILRNLGLGAAAHPWSGGSGERVSEQIQLPPRIENGGSIVVGKGGTLIAKGFPGSE